MLCIGVRMDLVTTDPSLKFAPKEEYFMPTTKIYTRSSGFLGRYETLVAIAWKSAAFCAFGMLVFQEQGPVPRENLWQVVLFLALFEVAIVGVALTSVSRFGKENSILKVPVLGKLIKRIYPVYSPKRAVVQLNFFLYSHFFLLR